MSALLVISLLVGYFGILILISIFTSKNATSETFFTGNRSSKWYLVAFGMIGTSLSGVTFISVPGKVYVDGMAYYQVVLGYILGYIVIAQVLMPLYYRLNVTSIYEFLNERFGIVSYKTGASFFILSRTLGSAMRLYLATFVLQKFLFDGLGVPYIVTAIITVLLIWVYTFKGGIKTIIYTDTFQTVFLIGAVVLSVFIISNALDMNLVDLYGAIKNQTSQLGEPMTKMIYLDDYKSPIYFPKYFFGGMFIAIAMTGLDQDMMQKNLSCKNIGEAQKNMYSFTTILVVVNFFFLLLGGALYVYSDVMNVALPMQNGAVVTDEVYPILAFEHLGLAVGVLFLLGILASSYASSDSALTALTTGFCIDFLNFNKREENEKKRLKFIVHIGFSLVFLIIALLTKLYMDKGGKDLIDVILKVASYTYGPLLGLFFFGILTKRKVNEILVPFVCVLAPIACFILASNSKEWLNGYVFSYEILILNGLLTFGLLTLISKRVKS
ncbi:MAG TPA: sodium:solute symporter [Crocinitomicaceae bacterium]|nr:sodium:solute symporter [Crocinitomicaceae bacterium]